MKKPKGLVASVVFFLAAASLAHGAEIKGTVREVNGDKAVITIEGDAFPSIGDQVEIFFKLAGADDEVGVGNGKVTAVNADSVEAKIGDTTGDVQKNQFARITSANPQKRSAASVASASPSAVVTASASATSSALSILGKWSGKARHGADWVFVFKSDGSVVLTVLMAGWEGLAFKGKYKVVSNSQPDRLNLTDFEVIYPANATDEEIKAFRARLEEAAKTGGDVATLHFLGELEGPTRLRIDRFAKDASDKTQMPADAPIFTKAREGETATAPASQWYPEFLSKFNSGDYDGAMAVCTKAIEADPKDAAAYFSRGLCHARKESWNNSLADADKALALSYAYPAYAYAMRAQARVRKHEFKIAIEDATKGISIDPQYAFSYRARAEAEIGLGNWKQVLEDCNKVLALEPNNGDAYILRGCYYSHSGATEAAEADWKKAIVIDPNNQKYVENARKMFPLKKKSTGKRRR
ncbi:MAG: hypothetical protein QOD12_1962 [Verrucomicrobiota bacterium]|jgi:tetratricopeptide (TPR) repeat protein